MTPRPELTPGRIDEVRQDITEYGISGTRGFEIGQTIRALIEYHEENEAIMGTPVIADDAKALSALAVEKESEKIPEGPTCKRCGKPTMGCAICDSCADFEFTHCL